MISRDESHAWSHVLLWVKVRCLVTGLWEWSYAPSYVVPGQVPGSGGWLGNWSGDEIGVVLIRWKNDLGTLHLPSRNCCPYTGLNLYYILGAPIFIFHLLTNTFPSRDLPLHLSITWPHHLTAYLFTYHVIPFGCACDSHWLLPSSMYPRAHAWVSSTRNDSILCTMTPY